MSKTILLADDSVTIRKVVELTFMDEPYELVSVGSGSEAIERLDSGVDLVIADVHMPGADGYEVCKASKSQAPRRPVMLLVGTFESYDESKAAEAAADDHLKKPFDSQDLLGRVRGLLAGAEAPVEPVSEPVPEAVAEPEVAPAFAADTEAVTPAEAGSAENGGESDRSQAPEAEADDATEDSGDVEVAATAEAPTAPDEPPLELSDETVDRIARRVVELLSEEAIRDVAWEVIPDLAEVVIKERLHDLESQVE